MLFYLLSDANTSATLDPLAAGENVHVPPVRRAKWHLGNMAIASWIDWKNEVHSVLFERLVKNG